jgi:hypothetical protein
MESVMRRIVLLFIGLLLLAACGPSGTPATPAAGGGDSTTAVPPQASNTQAVPAITPATTPEEAGIVRPQDWVKGATDPIVSIIDYGDFQ